MFIKVYSKRDNSNAIDKHVLNIEHVVAITLHADAQSAKVRLSDGSVYATVETFEEVENKLNKITEVY